jgi:hypothetical protein
MLYQTINWLRIIINLFYLFKFVDVCALSCVMFSIILVYNGYAIGYGLPDG